MNPHTVHRVAQEIRFIRGLLSVEEQHLRVQEKSELRDEEFRRINFWRKAIKSAELLLAQE